MPSLADFLAAYGGSPDPENPSSGEITPGLVLNALRYIDQAGGAAYGKMATDIATLPRRAVQGAAAYQPGIRREDVTDIPASGFGTEPADVVVGPAAEAAGTLMGVGSQFAQPGSAGIFMGRLSPTAPLEKYAQADKMLAKGATREEVHRATGLTLGADGQLRHEIPDYGTGFTEAGQKAIEAGTPTTLGEAYAHPELFAAAPQLRDVKIRFEDPVPGSNSFGGYDRNTGELFINPKMFDPVELSKYSLTENQIKKGVVPGLAGMRSTLLHESQHLMQGEQGFSAGGNVWMPEVKRAADKALKAQSAEADAALQKIYEQTGAYVREQQAAGREGTPQQFIKEYYDQNPDILRQAAALKYQREAPRRGGMMLNQARQNAYEALAGETEARNVQYRRDLTPEELAKTPAWETQDVPYAQQLLRFTDQYGNIKGRLRRATDAPSFSERMGQAQDIAQERRNRGFSTGDYGLGTARRTAPEAPAGSFEDFAARQQQGYRNDIAGILDAYREQTGLPRAGTERPLLAPGESSLEFQSERLRPKAPTVLRPDRPLFDLSPAGLARSHVEREQFDIPRTAAETVTPEYERATSKANIARVNKEVAQGIKEHGLDWHAMGQLRDRYIADLGEKAGAAEFERYMQEVGATSPNSNVEQNFRTASYYAQQRRAGEPLPKISYKRSTGNPYLPPREAPPTPYGNTAQGLHVMNLGLLERGEPYPLSRPKVPSFTENMLGNYRPVAVDRHNLRMWGIDAEAPNLTGYKHLERTQQEQAGKMGIHPAQYQAAPWPFYAKSGADPALALFDKRLTHTAEARGQTKAQVLRDFIRGVSPLLSVTPAAVLLGQGQPAQEPAQ